jgi:hypothetical protein
MESVCVILVVAAHHGWHVHHLDVKSVFLNSEVAQEVYVEQPRGFMLKGKENMVFGLHKALYGLHQVPRAWNCSPYIELAAIHDGHRTLHNVKQSNTFHDKVPKRNSRCES